MISANAVLPMCLVMALGYGTRRLGWIHREEISNINKVAFRIFLPCLLYYNVYCSDLSGWRSAIRCSWKSCRSAAA